MKPKILHSGVAAAAIHMARDAALLAGLATAAGPILHHYDWQGDSLTYGHFIQPDRLLNVSAVERRGMQTARRPTGGGLIFHVTDLAFSLLIPASHPRLSQNTLLNYAWVNGWVRSVLDQFLGNPVMLLAQTADTEPKLTSYCMAHPTQYDVILGGRKVGGAAQRRTRQGMLHQTSIYLAPLSEELVHDVVRDGDAVSAAMARASYPLLGPSPSATHIAAARQQLRHLLNESWVTLLN